MVSETLAGNDDIESNSLRCSPNTYLFARERNKVVRIIEVDRAPSSD